MGYHRTTQATTTTGDALMNYRDKAALVAFLIVLALALTLLAVA